MMVMIQADRQNKDAWEGASTKCSEDKDEMELYAYY